MPQPLPAISLVAVPGRRRPTLEIAREIERRGFSGIYMPSRYGNMAQCTGLALATERIRFGTAIAPIYAQTTEEFAAGAAFQLLVQAFEHVGRLHGLSTTCQVAPTRRWRRF